MENPQMHLANTIKATFSNFQNLSFDNHYSRLTVIHGPEIKRMKITSRETSNINREKNQSTGP